MKAKTALNRMLFEAVAKSDLAGLQRAFEEGADVNARDGKGATALMRAVGRGDDLEIVRFLVEHGADVSARDRAGRTPLDFLMIPDEPPEHWENAHEAWTHSEESYIWSYLERVGGTRGTAANPSGRDGAPQAAQTPEQTAPLSLRGKAPQKRPAPTGWDQMLFAAIQRGAANDVAEIIALDKANVNAIDKGGWTPLMRAAASNHTDIMRILLAGGADATIRDKRGCTVLSVAGPEAKAMLAEFSRPRG